MDPELINAIVLGIVQGFTEFLPVSSSGHLEIGKVILSSDLQGGESLLMTVVLHAATALSTVVVFHRDILTILTGLAKFKWNDDFAFSLKIGLSMIPAVVVGLTMEDAIESLFNGNLLLVGSMLLATGLLLFLAERAKRTSKPVSYLDAVLVGISQAIAILPGISRSGATISTSVLLGIDRMEAAKFSFLMVIPLIFGKMCKDIISGELSAESGDQSLPLLAGFLAAFLTGVIACKWMIALVRNFQLWWFSIYCFTVGAVAIGYRLFFS
jgi:undecaprenyl-diphosphatase